jgi:competence protein ComEA
VSALARRLVVAAALVAATPAFAAKKELGPAERIDLNRATVSELMRLPGVGQRKAQAIVARRQKAPFRRPEEVMQVKGCGRSWFQKVKANLTAGAPSATPVPAHATAAPPRA